MIYKYLNIFIDLKFSFCILKLVTLNLIDYNSKTIHFSEIILNCSKLMYPTVFNEDNLINFNLLNYSSRIKIYQLIISYPI